MRLTVTADTFDGWHRARPCMANRLMKSDPAQASIDHPAAASQQALAMTHVLQSGNRLSTMPMAGSEWQAVLALMDKEDPALV